jgi:tripartite-type tricarboxylate transporter receptor subunit TctC
VLLARPSLPAVTVGEVLELARSTPHGLSCATASGLPQLGCQMLRSLGRVPLTEVTFKGLGPAMSELMAERLDVMFQTYGAASPQVRAQRVKALASADAERRAGELGDLPVIAESLPGFRLASWTGIMAPAGTPEAIVRRLNREIADALRDPALREQVGRIGIDVATGPPEAFAELIRRDHERYGRLVREFGVRVR